MLRASLLIGCFAFLALTVTAAAEERIPGSGGISFKPLIRPQPDLITPAPPSPYPMTYSEQVAQSLGVRDGGLDLVRSDHSTPFAPSVSLTGSMVRLQWRP
jgi:hypothetical protein